MLLKTIIEVSFALGLFINAALFIPQIIRLNKSKNADGLSILTFAGFNLIQLLTLLHGVLHNDYILAVGSLLSLITCGVVTVLIIYYRNKDGFCIK